MYNTVCLFLFCSSQALLLHMRHRLLWDYKMQPPSVNRYPASHSSTPIMVRWHTLHPHVHIIPSHSLSLSLSPTLSFLLSISHSLSLTFTHITRYPYQQWALCSSSVPSQGVPCSPRLCRILRHCTLWWPHSQWVTESISFFEVIFSTIIIIIINLAIMLQALSRRHTLMAWSAGSPSTSLSRYMYMQLQNFTCWA